MNIIDLPLILKCDVAGLPVKWVSWRDAAVFYARDCVLWSTGAQKFEVKGGWQNGGERTVVYLDSIIATADKSKGFRTAPRLTNKTLFQRDRFICMYCGDKFKRQLLTRDHIMPLSKGGPNRWENCVTACKHCNGKKADKSLGQVNMKLLAVPYVPNMAEYLILSNRRILVDQMEFLEPFTSEEGKKSFLVDV